MNTTPHSNFPTNALIAGSLILCSSAFAQAQTVINYDTPAADSFVSVGHTDTNYGAETTWKTRYGANNSSQRLGYVRFDLNDQLLGSVSDATLTVTYASRSNVDAASATATVNVYGLKSSYIAPEGRLGFDWAESALTNANAPWAASGSGVPPASVELLGSFTVSVDPAEAAGATFSISGTALATFLESHRATGNNDVTFIFRSSTGTFFSFASKENTTYAAPSLTVTVNPSSIPEPASFATVLGAAILAAGAFRRRR